MTEGQAPVLRHLAANLKRLRQRAGLSQEQLSRLSGVSRRMLVGMEAGDSNVSLSTLDKVAAALGVLLPDLITDRSENPPRPVLAWTGRHRGSEAHLLQSVPASQLAELWEWVLMPGESYTSAADPAGWYEMVLVIEGELEITFADRVERLGPGQTLSYRSDRPFDYRPAADARVRFIRNVVI
ncbi:helix-turn-helix domain-containing protein [Zavarzinia compransoris]|uniref:Cro/Cl family transcriptional regulator n=1 Tax=Zavarzinia compransoris TaxID=1264899 RepID=A0A317EBW0_9PROT|nr:XRE family transcriptional regulator [Zavarzinia compransoris]PWR23600.1 Cro/Cl family transcriptional regulator [Zavarzinia compransoris]TDP47817.1 XRE family transcriptional regulator [Zavarzinia compransoris]